MGVSRSRVSKAPTRRRSRSRAQSDAQGRSGRGLLKRFLAPGKRAASMRNRRESPRTTPQPRNSRKAKAKTASPGIHARLRSTRDALLRFWVRSRRPVLVALKVCVVLLVAAGAVAAGRLVERHVRTSPAFETRDIRVGGLARLEREDVLEAAGLRLGSNAFDVAPEDAEARLVAHPWIAEATVRRRLPGTYEITVREHQAVALLSLSASEPGPLYLVSENGTVFKRMGEGDPVDVPVVTGIDRARFLRDRPWRTSILLEVVALLHDYRGAGLWRREPIGEVHVEADDGLSLYVGEDATHIRLGRGPFRGKLQRLRRVLDDLARRSTRAYYVYLDNVRRPDRVTVKVR